ncbi:MAG: DNRLRE domain-containing protein [Nocardioides sp.]
MKPLRTALLGLIVAIAGLALVPNPVQASAPPPPAAARSVVSTATTQLGTTTRNPDGSYTTRSIAPSRDCWLNQAAPTNHYCGDPSSYIRVGRQDTGTASRRRGLVDFDVSSIPADAHVTSASAWLYLDSSQTQTIASADYAVHEPGKAFGSATWNDSGGNGSWGGGNPGSTVYDVKTMNGQTSGYKSFDGLGSLVQGWVDGSRKRRGILLKQVGENVANTLYFHSSSSSATNNGKRPYLEVTYTLPPLPTDPFEGTEGAQTEIAPLTVFDSAADGQVASGSTRVVPIEIPGVATEDVDRVVAVVQVLDWTGSGSVTVYGADGVPLSVPTLSFDAAETVGKVKSVVVELEPSVESDPESIAITAAGSGAPRIVVLVRGWYGWAPEDTADDEPDLLSVAESDEVMAVSESTPVLAEPEEYVLDDFGRPQGLIEPDPSAVDDCVTTQPPGESPPACAEQYSLAGDPTESAPDTDQAALAAVAELHCSKEGPAWKIKTRTYGCRKTALAWAIGTGVVAFKVTEAIETDTRGKLVKHHWQVRLKENTTIFDWYDVTVTTHCRRGCDGVVANASSTEQFGTGEPKLGSKHVATATGDIAARTSSSDKGHTQPVSLFLRVKIEWLGAHSSKKRMKNTPYIRCDNVKYLNAGYGCVLPAGRVALDLYPPDDGTGESAALIADAQAGMYAHPGILTRPTSTGCLGCTMRRSVGATGGCQGQVSAGAQAVRQVLRRVPVRLDVPGLRDLASHGGRQVLRPLGESSSQLQGRVAARALLPDLADHRHRPAPEDGPLLREGQLAGVGAGAFVEPGDCPSAPTG